jgi:Co/Zn/Cd efflux system component
MARRSLQLSAVAYTLILAASALGRTYAIWLLLPLVRTRTPIAVSAVLLLGGSASAFAAVQQLWAGRAPARHLVRVGAKGALLFASLLLWLYGLEQTGALLTVIAEHALELLLRFALGLFAPDSGATSREHGRGAALIGVGFIALLATADEHGRRTRQGYIAHLAAAALALAGGARSRFSRRLALDVGGAKRLEALTHASALALAMPLALWAWVRTRGGGEGDASTADGVDGGGGGSGGDGSGFGALGTGPTGGAWLETMVLSLAMIVAPFYARALAQAGLPRGQPTRITSVASVGAVLLLELVLGTHSRLATLASLYPSPSSSSSSSSSFASSSSSALAFASALVLPAGLLCLLLGMRTSLRAQPGGAELRSLLASGTPPGHSQQQLGLPPLGRATRAVRAAGSELRAVLAVIWKRRSTRRLLLFLLISAAFTVVEAALGRSSSSLSLVSDACHMLVDCSGLAIGLYGELASRWPPSTSHTYGYERVEVLCTFANAMLLLLSALALSREAVVRVVWGSADIDTTRLLPIALGGLCVNMLGIFLFSEHHRHVSSAQPCVGCDTSAEGGSASATSANMAAVLLHVAADALGSLGVILSSLLIRFLGWTLAVRAIRTDAHRAPCSSAALVSGDWLRLRESAIAYLVRQASGRGERQAAR